MKYPNCSADLVKTTRHGVDVEACPSCKGSWLTPQDLDTLENEAFHLGDDEKGTLVFSSTVSETKDAPEADFRGVARSVWTFGVRR